MWPKYYMHQNSMDVCIEVINSDEDKYLCQFVNLGYDGNPFRQGPRIELPINTFNSKDWQQLTEDQLVIKRTKSGIPTKD